MTRFDEIINQQLDMLNQHYLVAQNDQEKMFILEQIRDLCNTYVEHTVHLNSCEEKINDHIRHRDSEKC